VNSKKHEISKYGYIIFISLIVSSLFNYLYQVVMGNMLNRSDFGVLGLALSTFFVVAVLLQNTFTWSGTRYMASEPELSPQIFDAVLLGNLALAIFLSAVALNIAKTSSFFNLSVLISATLIVGALLTSINSYLRAHKLFSNIACANVLSSITKFVSAILLVVAGYGATGAFSGVLVGMCVSLAYLLGVVRNRISTRVTIDTNILKKLLKESVFVAVVFTGITVIINFNIIILKLVNVSNCVIGDFNAALTISRGVFFLTSALVLVVFSYTSSSDPDREVYAVRSLRYVLLFIVPVVASIYINPKLWLILFFGSKYLVSQEVLRILVVGIGLTSIAFVVLSNLVAFEDNKVPAVLVVTGVLIMCAYSLQHKTAEGVAKAVEVSAAFLAFTTLAYYATKYKIRIRVGDCAKVIMANIAFLGGLLTPQSRVSAFAAICLTYALYVVVLVLTGVIDDSDMDTILAPLPESVRKKISNVCKHNKT